MSLQIEHKTDDFFHLPTFAPGCSDTNQSSRQPNTQNSLDKDSSDELTIGPPVQSKFFEKSLSQSSLINSIDSGK